MTLYRIKECRRINILTALFCCMDQQFMLHDRQVAAEWLSHYYFDVEFALF